MWRENNTENRKHRDLCVSLKHIILFVYDKNYRKLYFASPGFVKFRNRENKENDYSRILNLKKNNTLGSQHITNQINRKFKK